MCIFKFFLAREKSGKKEKKGEGRGRDPMCIFKFSLGKGEERGGGKEKMIEGRGKRPPCVYLNFPWGRKKKEGEEKRR